MDHGPGADRFFVEGIDSDTRSFFQERILPAEMTYNA